MSLGSREPRVEWGVVRLREWCGAIQPPYSGVMWPCFVDVISRTRLSCPDSTTSGPPPHPCRVDSRGPGGWWSGLEEFKIHFHGVTLRFEAQVKDRTGSD